MSTVVSRLDEAREAVKARLGAAPRLGVVLGSGLGMFAESLEGATSMPYDDIPHMPGTAVAGHQGKLWRGEVGGVEVACLQGRAHTYEGHEPSSVVFGARLLARLGAEAVLLSNAAGGINASFTPGTLMLITDHLNLMARSPLLGPNEEELGPRFPDMTRAYDPHFAALAREAAVEIDLTLEQGVYAALLGPTYETPAEIRMLRHLGADAVGMSTVPEVIALRHMGVRVGAVSCITNLGAGLGTETLSHDEVAETARRVGDQFMALFSGWIERIGATLDER